MRFTVTKNIQRQSVSNQKHQDTNQTKSWINISLKPESFVYKKIPTPINIESDNTKMFIDKPNGPCQYMMRNSNREIN